MNKQLLITLFGATLSACTMAADWPMWGGTLARNQVNDTARVSGINQDGPLTLERRDGLWVVLERGWSAHSVPSLSNTAIRSLAGT